MKFATLVSNCSNSDVLRRCIYDDHYGRLRAAGLLSEWKTTFVEEYGRFLRALSGKTGDALVIAADETVLGYLIFQERPTITGSSATIVAFRVKPAYRGIGYGRALIGRLMDIARQAGWERVTVDVGLGADARRARALYRTVGFKPTSVILEVVPPRRR